MNKATTVKAIHLKGDPRKPESAVHIITFPGGSIELSRTSDDEYWVHMAVNKKEIVNDIPSQSKRGIVVDTRVDRIYPFGTSELENIDQIQHLAIHIRTE